MWTRGVIDVGHAHCDPGFLISSRQLCVQKFSDSRAFANPQLELVLYFQPGLLTFRIWGTVLYYSYILVCYSYILLYVPSYKYKTPSFLPPLPFPAFYQLLALSPCFFFFLSFSFNSLSFSCHLSSSFLLSCFFQLAVCPNCFFPPVSLSLPPLFFLPWLM